MQDIRSQHNLLSINGAFTPQPFIVDGLACVYNGEIYNSSDFGGFESDGVCLLPAYKALGPRFVRELDGEFAIVIFDRSKAALFISADVFGTKPIHYSFSGDHFGVASYSSALEAIGFSSITRLEPNHYVTISVAENRLTATGTIFDFSLRQYKTHFDDWSDAFTLAIKKRAKHSKEKIFIGLSSGYDSGAISCELDKQGIGYKSYSIMSNEKIAVIKDRVLRRRSGSEFEFIYPSEEEKLRTRQYLKKTVERVSRDIVSTGSRQVERWSLHDDAAAMGLAIICGKARKEKRRIYLSGQGADEILSDYGFLGTPIYAHSNFGGRYPEDLTSIFPWPSAFINSSTSVEGRMDYPDHCFQAIEPSRVYRRRNGPSAALLRAAALLDSTSLDGKSDG